MGSRRRRRSKKQQRHDPVVLGYAADAEPAPGWNRRRWRNVTAACHIGCTYLLWLLATTQRLPPWIPDVATGCAWYLLASPAILLPDVVPIKSPEARQVFLFAFVLPINSFFCASALFAISDRLPHRRATEG